MSSPVFFNESGHKEIVVQNMSVSPIGSTGDLVKPNGSFVIVRDQTIPLVSLPENTNYTSRTVVYTTEKGRLSPNVRNVSFGSDVNEERMRSLSSLSSDPEKWSPSSRGFNFSWGSDVFDQNWKMAPLSPNRLKSAQDFASNSAGKLDPRYFGELLADLNRKTTDLHDYLLEHVEKIRGSCKPIPSHHASELELHEAGNV
nr:PREDICTED: protein POF1B-like [Latimeria chalumnae]|eukprot:XP_006011245.1 PREDICTED: protein POF1B-like [Latimeria chalumnae]